MILQNIVRWCRNIQLKRIADKKKRKEILEIEQLISKHVDISAWPDVVLQTSTEIRWRVKTKLSGDVYMAEKIGYHPDCYIVYAHAEKFYRAWLEVDSSDYQACLLRDEMHLDRKYSFQEQCWSQSEEWPVPLADVSPIDRKLKGWISIGFTDGMTRSMWLLRNQAQVFPVKCYGKDEAQKLAEWIGVCDPLRVTPA